MKSSIWATRAVGQMSRPADRPADRAFPRRAERRVNEIGEG